MEIPAKLGETGVTGAGILALSITFPSVSRSLLPRVAFAFASFSSFLLSFSPFFLFYLSCFLSSFFFSFLFFSFLSFSVCVRVFFLCHLSFPTTPLGWTLETSGPAGGKPGGILLFYACPGGGQNLLRKGSRAAAVEGCGSGPGRAEAQTRPRLRSRPYGGGLAFLLRGSATAA